MLQSLWVEQAAIWIDGPSPATGEGNGEGADTPWLPLECICAQYEFRFFALEKSKFVASTAKRQRGLSRGKFGPP